MEDNCKLHPEISFNKFQRSCVDKVYGCNRSEQVNKETARNEFWAAYKTYILRIGHRRRKSGYVQSP